MYKPRSTAEPLDERTLRPVARTEQGVYPQVVSDRLLVSDPGYELEKGAGQVQGVRLVFISREDEE